MDPEKIRFHIRPNRLQRGVRRVITGKQGFVRNFKGGRLMVWHGVVIVHLMHHDFILPDQVIPDLMIIGNNAVRNTDRIPLKYKSAKIILDSSNSFYYSEKFIDQWKTRNVSVYWVQKHGAFDLTIG
jgi:hypothetical protein